MSILVALVLGIVQGLTEFLPVSSSGHLFLLNEIFGVDGDFLLLSIILHLATLLAVIIVFYKDIWQLIKHPFSKQACNLYIATIPTVAIVFLFKFALGNIFENASLLPFCFMVTAVLLLITYLLSNKKVEDRSYENDFNGTVKWTSALGMGIAQGLATIPGISRSGSTICTGLLLGESRKESAKFSFLMSIPIIIASMLYEIIFTSSSQTLSQIGIVPLLVAFVSAFLVGIFSIKFMLKIVEKAKYYYFSIYLFILSIVSMFIV